MDLAEAQRRGIVVTRAPGSNTPAVAEHTLAMILALAKDLPAVGPGGRRRLAAARDQVRDIAGLRLGLLGCGAIGQAVARLAAAFGMEVAAFTPGGRRRCPCARACPRCSPGRDVLSLHLPLRPGDPAPDRRRRAGRCCRRAPS